ncbi:unnamed protein product [Acanthocheilonema viteae]|uniref:Uncharacterized protein n=1 Tax=Acanthocheilonema viteae TaxID=6277 RepID=A0A498SVQ1_ACAVI|nr:unnamed protein product [Acanthocheilonema viteae]
MMRDIVEKRINEPFRTMSKVVPLSKLSNFAKKAINSIKLADLPKHCRMQPCKERIHDHKTITHFPTSTANLNILSTDIKSTFTANGNTIDNRKSSTIQTKHTDVSHKLKHGNMHKISDTSSTHQLSSIHTKTLRNVTSSPILATSDMDVHQMDTLNFIDPCANCYSSNKSIPINNLDNVNKYIDEADFTQCSAKYAFN